MSDGLGLEKIGIEVDEVIPYTLIENYIFDIEGLSANKKLFILMLRRYAGAEKKPAFPSYNMLMKSTGVNSKSTIAKNIDFFIWLKWLERINRFNDKGEKIENYYILSLKNIRLVLEHFAGKKITFKEIEKYFEENYLDDKRKVNKTFLESPCKYLVE